MVLHIQNWSSFVLVFILFLVVHFLFNQWRSLVYVVAFRVHYCFSSLSHLEVGERDCHFIPLLNRLINTNLQTIVHTENINILFELRINLQLNCSYQHLTLIMFKILHKIFWTFSISRKIFQQLHLKNNESAKVLLIAC